MSREKRSSRTTKIIYPRPLDARPRRQTHTQERSWQRACMCFWSAMTELDMTSPPAVQRGEREVLDSYTRREVELYVIGGRDLAADRAREAARAAARQRWLRLVDDGDERVFILPANRTFVREHGEMREQDD